ncbi:hypothetical protein PoB_004450500 [Plakobranchus ocellatus]|uniref:Uncharacterized protein n=1 Tax=Plakobranchus ocellatus TaxID=259542 RepID=A0AAV4BFX6_9GAST|nr:hypothetical protein PoB_004450500 [Plakobranchus ocellatus]
MRQWSLINVHCCASQLWTVVNRGTASFGQLQLAVCTAACLHSPVESKVAATAAAARLSLAWDRIVQQSQFSLHVDNGQRLGTRQKAAIEKLSEGPGACRKLAQLAQSRLLDRAKQHQQHGSGSQQQQQQ